jgi:hypothetical protein
MSKRHQLRSFEEQDRLNQKIEELEVDRTAGETLCSGQCPFFGHFGKRITAREGSNAGRCPVVGKEVYVGFTVCERLRV